MRDGGADAILQFVAQEGARTMQAGLHRFFRESEAPGCLARVELLYFAEYEDRTIDLRQRIQRSLQNLSYLTTHSERLRRFR